MPTPTVPFEEIPHTADWAIRAYGRSLPELFAHAAIGMYSLLTDLEALGESERREVQVEAASPEGLLVAWLNE
ncbi:MAG: archease, partial [Thermoflexus sp.]